MKIILIVIFSMWYIGLILCITGTVLHELALMEMDDKIEMNKIRLHHWFFEP